MEEEKLEILIVEDNPGDVYLISELLGELGNSIHIILMKDGREALDIITNAASHNNAPSPDFVILDLNLTKSIGFDVLRI
jgi:CheY-like chemotaxis protein